MTQNWLLWLKIAYALIVGHEIIIPTFWFWDMDIDMFNCSRVGGRMRRDVCFPALTVCSLLEQTSCTVVLSWALVMASIPAGLSHNLSHPGHAVAPNCTPLSHNPQWDPFSTFPQRTPIPWRIIWVSTVYGALTHYAATPVSSSPYFSLSWNLCEVRLIECHLGSQPQVFILLILS